MLGLAVQSGETLYAAREGVPFDVKYPAYLVYDE